MNNEQNPPGMLDKTMKLGSSIGAALMLIGGTPEEKAHARETLNATAPPGAAPPTFAAPGTPEVPSFFAGPGAPAHTSLGLSGLTGTKATTPVSTPAAPSTAIPTSDGSGDGSGLSGFSGVGANPGTPPAGIAGTGGPTTLLPGVLPGATPGVKPLLP